MDNNPEPNVLLAVLNIGALILSAGAVCAGLLLVAAWVWHHF